MISDVKDIKHKKRSRVPYRLVLQGVNHLLWPAVCTNCGSSISEVPGSMERNSLCQQCWDELLSCCGGEYCRRCGRDAGRYAVVDGKCPSCQNEEIILESITRAGVYKEALQQMILAFKKGRTELASILCFLAGSALQGCGFFEEIDFLVPVPLHWSRRLARGYNQSLLLAKKIKHPSSGISTELVRIRRTKIQSGMTSYTARVRNVTGAFAVRRGHPFKGRSICLIDDIKTTGATLNECARTLKDAGASSVFALVIAVAGQSRPWAKG